MASKKKHPSFEIPDVVRKAGQSGWVYRTGPENKRKASAPRTRKVARPAVSTRAAAASAPPPQEAAIVTVAQPPGVEQTAGRTSGLVDFGLHVAAIPLVVPLYLTAAISRRLGFNGKQ